MGRGFVEGFKLFFYTNLAANIKAVFLNLFNLWLGKAGLSVPEFSVAGLIKFGLELIGVDVDSILKSFGLTKAFEAVSDKTKIKTPLDEVTKVREDPRLELDIRNAEATLQAVRDRRNADGLTEEDKKKLDAELLKAQQQKNELLSKKEKTIRGAGDLSSQKETMEAEAQGGEQQGGLDGLASALQSQGISALIPYITAHIGDIAQEIITEAIKSLIKPAATKAIAKLAMMANPVGGIIAAIKAVWDLIQFVRSNMKAISGLAGAILDCLVAAANGESAYVATAVEATLCQAFPLVIEMALRLAGIDIGGMIKGFVDKHIRGRVQRILDKIINTFRSSGNKMVSGAANKVKTSQEREAKEEKQKADADAAAKETKDKRLAGKASGNKADRPGLWASNATEWLEAEQKTQKASAFHVTGLTSALNGEREGNLGVDLDKSKRLQERIKYYEDKRNAKREAQKKQIAETHENGDNDEGGVRAVEELSAVNGIETKSQSALIATEENQEDNSEIKEREDQDQSHEKGENRSIPQGISLEQFERLSQTVRDHFINISQDIRVQGSRAAWTARDDSDIDIAVLVSPEEFDALIEQYFKTPNPGSSREKTKMWAREKGKIQAGEARAHALREELKRMLNMKVDVSIIKIGGEFDTPPYIPLK